jgi:hypothetical protein
VSGYKDFSDGSYFTADEVDGYLMRQTVMRFTTEASRDLALTVGVVAEGMVAYTEDTDTFWVYSGSAWYAMFPRPTSTFSTTDLIAETSTSFVPGSTVCGMTFVAPRSGMVYVNVAGHIEQNTASNSSYLCAEVREGSTIGSGTVVFAANTDEGIGVGTAAVTRIMASRENLVTGLTPGNTYNVRTMHLTTPAGSTDVFFRKIIVKPVL